MSAAHPVLGKILGSGKAATINVARLLLSRLLILADSGAGKSWLIRKLCEVCFGHVLIFIIDREGEYESLREKFPFLIVGGENGDVPASTATAALLARRLVETSTSAVININDLRAVPYKDARKEDGENRQSFVGTFFTALLELPKSLRKPILVLVDEGSDIAPEGGKEPPSLMPTIDLNFKGRKRGICLVIAGQASALLSKNAIRGMANKIIGRTALPADNKAAAAELRLDRDGAEELRGLADGVFFAYGPAIAKQIVKIKVGRVATTHPEPGKPQAVIPAPPAKVKAVLKELRDLPKQVRAERETEEERKAQVESLRAEVKRLQEELVVAKKKVQVEVEVEEKFIFRRGEVNKRTKALDIATKKLEKYTARRAELLTEARVIVDREAQAQQAVVSELGNVRTALGLERAGAALSQDERIVVASARGAQAALRAVPSMSSVPHTAPTGAPVDLKARIVETVGYFHPVTLSRQQIAALCHISRTTQTFISAMAELGGEGKIIGEKGRYRAPVEVPAGPWSHPLDKAERVEIIRARARMDELASRALTELLHVEDINREELAGKLSISRTTQRFISAMSFLRACDWIAARKGRVRLSSFITEGRP